MGKTNVEYADEQITVYPAPCSFRCRYCWGQDPLWVHRTRNANPIKEAWKYASAKKPRIIVISFPTDPYQLIEKERGLTREVLGILVDNSGVNHQILILTKNPELAVNRDLDLLRWENVWLMTTLTSTTKISDEPNAPGNYDRITYLEQAHLEGVNTGVSIEPWIPEKTFPRQIIEATHQFVDWYVVGRLDYETRYGYPRIPKGYYREELKWVRALFDEFGFSPSDKPCERGYHIKKQLQENP